MHNFSGKRPYSIKKMRSVEDEQGERSKGIPGGETFPGRKLKYEIADEMGVLDKVIKDGWKASLQKKPDGSAVL